MQAESGRDPTNVRFQIFPKRMSRGPPWTTRQPFNTHAEADYMKDEILTMVSDRDLRKSRGVRPVRADGNRSNCSCGRIRHNRTDRMPLAPAISHRPGAARDCASWSRRRAQHRGPRDERVGASGAVADHSGPALQVDRTRVRVKADANSPSAAASARRPRASRENRATVPDSVTAVFGTSAAR